MCSVVAIIQPRYWALNRMLNPRARSSELESWSYLGYTAWCVGFIRFDVWGLLGGSRVVTSGVIRPLISVNYKYRYPS